MSVWFWIGQGALFVWCVVNICIALQQRHEEKVACGCGMKRVFNHGSRKHRRRVELDRTMAEVEEAITRLEGGGR